MPAIIKGRQGYYAGPQRWPRWTPDLDRALVYARAGSAKGMVTRLNQRTYERAHAEVLTVKVILDDSGSN